MSGMPDTNERDIVTELKMGRFESPYLQRAIDEIESLREQVAAAEKVKTIAITGEAIRDLADFAGFSVQERDADMQELMETEYVLRTTSPSYMPINEETGEAVECMALVYLSDYPEEGCVPLGMKAPEEQQAKGEQDD